MQFPEPHVLEELQQIAIRQLSLPKGFSHNTRLGSACAGLLLSFHFSRDLQ